MPGHRVTGPARSAAPGGHHVLFIGNSLTYTNDLPNTVVELARSVVDTIRAASVAHPNLAVIDHALGLSSAIDAIEGQPSEMVILQQGPTTTAVNRFRCREATVRFLQRIAHETVLMYQ